MHFFWVFLIFFPFSSYASQLNDVIIDQPLPTKLNKIEEETLIFYLNHLGPPSAEHFYRIAGFYIQTGEFDQAEEALFKALAENPEFAKGWAQLGFISLWLKNWNLARGFFQKAWVLAPCNPQVAMGMIRLALLDPKEDGNKFLAELQMCHWEKDPDLLLYFGILNTRLHHWEEAEKAIHECLTISPHYKDAYFQLANLYLMQKRDAEASAIYEKYPDDAGALLGQAQIAERKGDYKVAEKFYCQALKKQPKNFEIRTGYAKVLTARLKYKKAKQQYQILTREKDLQVGKFSTISEREREKNWIRSMDVKSHTNIGFEEELDYTDAKENDPSLRVPVVKDYYFTSKFTVFIPIIDRWRLDAQQFYYHQRENDIYVPSVNYSAYVNGGSLYSHYFFAKDWEWQVVLKGIRATGIQNANYPFKSSSFFEPGSRIAYNGLSNLLILDAHVEDQIIKNFSRNISQLLRIDVYQGGYGFHPEALLHPNFEIWAGKNFYHDSIPNWKLYQKVRAEIDLWPKILRLMYLVTHGKFRRLTENYFSYKNQIEQTLSLQCRVDLHAKMELEVLWDHYWQSNRNVILPVGSFLFVASKLYLIGNRLTGLLRYRFQDHLRLEISGHYLYYTLPYRDWNLKGAILWQF